MKEIILHTKEVSIVRVLSNENRQLLIQKLKRLSLKNVFASVGDLNYIERYLLRSLAWELDKTVFIKLLYVELIIKIKEIKGERYKEEPFNGLEWSLYECSLRPVEEEEKVIPIERAIIKALIEDGIKK